MSHKTSILYISELHDHRMFSGVVKYAQEHEWHIDAPLAFILAFALFWTGLSLSWEAAALGFFWDAWFGAKLPAAAMDELLRTPTYSTWQGETWLFEGPTPMIYLGCWQASNFDAHAEDGNGERLFLEAVQDADEGTWDDLADGSISVYVFRSPTSGRLRGTWDRD